MFITLVKYLIDPFSIFWLVLLFTFVAWFLKNERLSRRLSILTVFCFLLISTPLIPSAIINSLEDQYEPVYIKTLADPEAEYHIIVLGGGHGFDERLPANSLLSHTALGRLDEGIRLYRRLSNSELVLSGNTGTPNSTTQAQMLQKAALLMGIDKNAIILQNEPRNTFEEAEVYAKNYGNRYPIILVTSAAHMPRAMQSFKHFGMTPIPSPTNYRLKGSWKKKWYGLPAMRNIENLKAGIYEYVAMLWYWIRE